jgi:hypothetical protein
LIAIALLAFLAEFWLAEFCHHVPVGSSGESLE